MYKNILFPVDITEEHSWKKALSVALVYAETFKAKIHILNVVPAYGIHMMQQYFPVGAIDEMIAKANVQLHDFAKRHFPPSFPTQQIIGKGAVYECIIETAKEVDADLIIMTAHRPELKDYLLGPNAAKVVRHANRSVLVVRDSYES